MRTWTCFAAGVVVAGSLAAGARADYAGVCAALGAIDNPGLAPIGVFGTCLGGFADTGYQNTPFETASTGYDYTVPTGEGAPAGETTDFHWVHGGGGPYNDPATGVKYAWPISGLEFIVHPSIDHTPLPEESLEVMLWGSNDGINWTLGTLVEVYEQGWSPDSIEDDGSSRWLFAQSYSLISMTSGLRQGSYDYGSDDCEVDAVTMLPTPGAAMLGVTGALVLTRRRRN